MSNLVSKPRWSGSSSKNKNNNSEMPIFRLERVDIKMTEHLDSNMMKMTMKLSKLVISNNIAVFALLESIYRVTFTGNESRHERVPIPLRSDDALENIFLDHTGCHCIVSTKKGSVTCCSVLIMCRIFCLHFCFFLSN